MTALIECIPNFSEGRDQSVIDEIVSAMTAVAGVRLLQVSANPDHHRAVVSLVGPATQLGEAVFAGIRVARDRIDLRRHQGVHPRIGATDVVPFVPLAGARLEDCIFLARQLGARVAEELGIPVYLYEAAATRPERRDLAAIRRGQLDELAHRIANDPAWRPDFGAPMLHPSAGAVVIGARWPLLAYNVNLRTDDVSIAEAIARAVRHQTGGLRYVKALGVIDGGRAQVTLNLTHPRATPPHRVLALIKAEAERYGVSVAGSEIIGLAPLDSLLAAAEHHLGLNGFRRDQILEWQLLADQQPPDALGRAVEEPAALETSLVPYLDALASAAPTPGGGSGAALAGALAAALAAMVANLTLGREKFAAVEERMTALLSDLTQARWQLTAAMREDAAAFEAYMAARRLPRGSAEEKATRQVALQAATLAAAEAPLAVARQSLALLPLCQQLAEAGNPSVASDAGVAALLAEAAVRGAGLNVRVNLPGLADTARRQALADELAALEAAATPLAAAVVELVQSIIDPQPVPAPQTETSG